MEIAEIKQQLTIGQVLDHYNLSADKNNMLDKKTLRRLQDIQKLNEKDREHVLEMVDAFIRDRKTKTAYAD